MARADVPPIHFDGRIYWYSERYDPADDRCSLCRGPIGEDDVPLMLFKDAPGDATWMARFCDTCTPVLLQFVTPPRGKC